LGTQQYPCFSANFFAEFIVTTGRTPRNKALLSRSGLLPGTIFSKEMHGEMIRFVVRRLCLRKADDPSVVNGCANNQAHSGTTDYLYISEMLMVKSSAFAKQATIRSPMDV
jgi:hypothetical protein